MYMYVYACQYTHTCIYAHYTMQVGACIFISYRYVLDIRITTTALDPACFPQDSKLLASTAHGKPSVTLWSTEANDREDVR